jgi:hypothetical protein
MSFNLVPNLKNLGLKLCFLDREREKENSSLISFSFISKNKVYPKNFIESKK